MRIIQITDLHVPADGEDTYGIDIRKNVNALLQEIPTFQPDLLVVSGDLCFMSGNETVYHWVKDKIDGLNIPYRIIPGNHDDPEMMAKVFDVVEHLKEGTLFYQETGYGHNMLFLDSTAGVLSDLQLNWLKEKLGQINGPVLLFVHHPPIDSGVPFMDQNHRLKNRDEVLNLLVQYPDNVHVFSGHYHVDKTIAHKNVLVHITPSCFMQIDQWEEAFKVDHYRVGFREIDLKEDVVLSTVRYIS